MIWVCGSRRYGNSCYIIVLIMSWLLIFYLCQLALVLLTHVICICTRWTICGHINIPSSRCTTNYFDFQNITFYQQVLLWLLSKDNVVCVYVWGLESCIHISVGIKVIEFGHAVRRLLNIMNVQCQYLIKYLRLLVVLKCDELISLCEISVLIYTSPDLKNWNNVYKYNFTVHNKYLFRINDTHEAHVQSVKRCKSDHRSRKFWLT